jgi:outer membrane protein TolC
MPVIIIIFALLYFSAAYGEMLTYKDVVRETIKTSARVKVKGEDINISEANYRQSVSYLYPELTLNSRIEKFDTLKQQGGISTISGQVISGTRDEWRTTLYLMGEYYLSNWYRKFYDVSYYEKLKEASIYDCEIETKKVLREITDIYSALYEAKIKLKYSGDIIKRLEGIIAFKKRLFKDGEISYEDILKAETEMVNAEKERTNIIKDLKEYLGKLSWYTGRTYKEDVLIDELVLQGKPFTNEILKKIENIAEYKARLKELEALKEKYKSIAKNFLPDLSVYGRYDLYGSNPETLRGSFDDVRKTAFSAGFFATIPLFDGGKRKWERVRTVHEIRKQEEYIKSVTEEKGRDLDALYVNYSELSKTLKHYMELTDRYRKMLNITKKAFGLGERSMIDVLEMEKDTLSIERDLKVTENSKANIEKKIFLETDYGNFITEFYGDRTCKY